MPDLSNYKIPIVPGINDDPKPPNFEDNGRGCNGSYFIDKYHGLVEFLEAQEPVPADRIVNGTTVLKVDGPDGTISGDIGGTPYFKFQLGTVTGQEGDIAIGENALLSSPEGGRYCVAIGTESLKNNSGYYNLGIGSWALTSNTTGEYNCALGDSSLSSNTTGHNNTAVNYALLQNTTGGDNTAIGAFCLDNNTTGSWLTAVGSNSLKSNTTGWGNVGVGYGALQNNSTGVGNIAIGYNSQVGVLGETNTNGNVSIGSSALKSITTGNDNFAAGYESLFNNTTGERNVAVGIRTLRELTSGSLNTALGPEAGKNLTTGSNNIVVGYDSSASSATVSNEITLGNSSITSFRIPGLGFNLGSVAAATNGQALVYNSTSGRWEAGTVSGGTDGGASSVSRILAGTNINITPGDGQGEVTINSVPQFIQKVTHTLTIYEDSLSGQTIHISKPDTYDSSLLGQTFVGWNAGMNSAGGRNVYVGEGAGTNNLGSYNVGIGRCALLTNYAGDGYYHATGSYNVVIGYNAGYALLSTGKSNTFIGPHVCSALNNPYLVWPLSSSFDPTNSGISGSNNIVIGRFALPSVASVSNEITLGNAAVTSLRCAVTSITSLSDARDKKDVQDLPAGLGFLSTLRPVKFVWDTRDGAKKDIPAAGFIAQELQQAEVGNEYLQLVNDNNPDKLEATPGNLIPVLVKAVQELRQLVLQQQQEIDLLKQAVLAN